jgi:steroid delta-isomerase-like uncharacterized protein
MSERDNEMLVRRFVTEAINGRRLDLLEQFLAPDYADLSAGTRAGFSVEDLRGEFENWFRAFPDHRVEIEQLVAAGDLVATRSACSATHRGEYCGVAATGQIITFAAHEMYRVRNGLISEHWEIWDEAGVLRQLGILVEATSTP